MASDDQKPVKGILKNSTSFDKAENSAYVLKVFFVNYCSVEIEGK